ncbi:MAG: SAM-dependent methyltransferase [Phycisphaerales bacterium]|jgi:23S rRNA (uridine2552-2'-O)-methyltransferase
MKEVQDHWFRLAKAEGYRARSAYKLLELDERLRLLRKGDRVLDAGAAPGSWTQVAARIVGERGRVESVDLKAIDPKGLPANVRVHQADLREITHESLGGGRFDAVISDMAPDTSGVPMADAAISCRLCHALLDRCAHLLRPGGSLVMKVFEGGDYPELLKRAKSLFAEAGASKPKASRAESVEIFIWGKGWKGPPQNGDEAPARARPQPGAGWRKPEA